MLEMNNKQWYEQYEDHKDGCEVLGIEFNQAFAEYKKEMIEEEKRQRKEYSQFIKRHNWNYG